MGINNNWKLIEECDKIEGRSKVLFLITVLIIQLLEDAKGDCTICKVNSHRKISP